MTARHSLKHSFQKSKTSWFILFSLFTLLVYTISARASQRNEARGILGNARVNGGLIVHIGCGDGKLTAALRANNRFLVHGLDTDMTHIQKARAIQHWGYRLENQPGSERSVLRPRAG